MMSVKSPMMHSPSANGLMSTFSAFSNLPGSPRPHPTALRNSIIASSQDDPAHLAAPSPNTSSNSGSNETFIDPSPIAPSSNGTEFTDLEGEVHEQQNRVTNRILQPLITTSRRDSSRIVQQQDLTIQTTMPTRHTPLRPRSDEDEAPQSVIHAPPGFSDFVSAGPREPVRTRTSPSPSLQSDTTIKSPVRESTEKWSNGTRSPPLLNTSFKPSKGWSERPTPRAQTRSEVEFEKKIGGSSNLEGIPEGPIDADADPVPDESESELEDLQKTIGKFKDSAEEIAALKTALAECWTLCNTLASLSYIHRERIFNFSGRGESQEQAWKSCWKLCQKLYESRDDDSNTHVRPTLDLCRDFCQALFEVRVIESEAADSVLRVSFELNNHLFNTHDRNLPEAFRERTLDFYITLCHRLMKQKARMGEETESLLRTCWSLAEMLFSIRQSKRESKEPNEELLGSAIQACWELCDLFREGWTQIRPDRGTPRPSQTTFTQAFQQAKEFGYITSEAEAAQKGFPETPTTIFEDTANMSPDEEPTPNILVLGAKPINIRPRSQSPLPPPQSTQSRRPPIIPHNNWSSTTLSSSSHNSTLSAASSSQTITSPLIRAADRHTPTPSRSTSNPPNGTMSMSPEELTMTLLKLLFVKAAQNSGFTRSSSLTLPQFARTMPPDSFGTLNWQTTLLENYRKAVLTDEKAFRDVGPPMRAGAVHVAKAVQAMVQGGSGGAENGFRWLRDLYRLVFGFYAEEAVRRKGVAVQT